MNTQLISLSLSRRLSEFGSHLDKQFAESFENKGPLAAFDSLFSPRRGATISDGVYLPIDIGGTNIRAYRIEVKSGKIIGAKALLDGTYENYFGNRKDLEVDEFFVQLSEVLREHALVEGSYRMPLIWSNSLSKKVDGDSLEAIIEKLPGTYAKNEPFRKKAKTGINICTAARNAFSKRGITLQIKPGNDTDFDCLSEQDLDVAIIASTGGNLARLKRNSDGTSSYIAHEVGGRCTGHEILLTSAEQSHFNSGLDPYLSRAVSFEDLFCGNNLAYLLAINLQGASSRSTKEAASRIGNRIIHHLISDQEQQSTEYKERFGRFISKALRTKAYIKDPSLIGPRYSTQEELIEAAKEFLGDDVTIRDLELLSDYAAKHILRAGAACGELIASSVEHLREKIEAGGKVRIGIDSAMMEHYPYYYEEAVKRIEQRFGKHSSNVEFVFLRSAEVPNLDNPNELVKLSAPILGGLYAFAA